MFRFVMVLCLLRCACKFSHEPSGVRDEKGEGLIQNKEKQTTRKINRGCILCLALPASILLYSGLLLLVSSG